MRVFAGQKPKILALVMEWLKCFGVCTGLLTLSQKSSTCGAGHFKYCQSLNHNYGLSNFDVSTLKRKHPQIYTFTSEEADWAEAGK